MNHEDRFCKPLDTNVNVVKAVTMEDVVSRQPLNLLHKENGMRLRVDKKKQESLTPNES